MLFNIESHTPYKGDEKLNYSFWLFPTIIIEQSSNDKLGNYKFLGGLKITFSFLFWSVIFFKRNKSK